MFRILNIIISNEIFRYIISSIIGAGIVAFINIKYTKKKNVKIDYKIKAYSDFFLALNRLYNDKTDEKAWKDYSVSRNLLTIYAGDDFLNSLINFEKNGLGIKYEQQNQFDKELYKLVEKTRVELGNKSNKRKNKWANYFYFINFNKK